MYGEREEPLRVRVVMSADGSSLAASYAGTTVTYIPVTDLSEDVKRCE